MANASIISVYNNSNVRKATTHIYICSKLEFSSLTYSCNFSRFGSGLCHLSRGPVTCEWILYLDCAVLPHEHLALPEPSGTPRAFPKTKELLSRSGKTPPCRLAGAAIFGLLNDSISVTGESRIANDEANLSVLPSQFVLVECLATNVSDLLPRYLRKLLARELLVLVICGLCLLLGLLLFTDVNWV